MGLFVEGHQLPNRGVAIPVAQGVQGHLHAVVPQQGIVVQQLEDLHHHLDGDAGADRRALPRACVQPQEPVSLEAALPVVDHVGIDRQQRGHASGAKADLEPFIKRRVNPALGFGAFDPARQTIQGYEAMHMFRKGQIEGLTKTDVLAQNHIIDQLFGVVA